MDFQSFHQAPTALTDVCTRSIIIKIFLTENEFIKKNFYLSL
ncbi:hypothetical protein SAMN05421638_0533 [Kaistella treverensis]|uniref:Uncharacterized protein n=1 Tax=Kaistella treverensis TaxID=631455 RepID=A0A1I3K1Y7_9FLAO|nr:hypothetical protein SAMN05421638_0533 [Kaistella treverensis]